MTNPDFQGFSRTTLTFLDDLKANNNREWFLQNKPVYEAEVKEPAVEFCNSMSQGLAAMTGLEHRSKIFRVHRDVRFSKDKTPYNAHLHISFSPASALASPPMWFFGLGTEKVSLGAGVFAFDKSELDTFRSRIDGPGGADIAGMVEAVSKTGARVSEPELKRVPSGYPKDHPHGDLLRHKGLSSWLDYEDRNWLLKPTVVSQCLRDFEKLLPLFRCLIDD